MDKLKPFVRLDFMTVKPYFTIKNLLIYAAVALFLSVVSGNIASGIGIGMMLGTMFVGYPFAIGEKSNLDALYAILSVNRKTVVLGRYIFALALNACAVLFSFAFSAAGLFAVKISGSSADSADPLWSVISLSAVFVIIQVTQLPIFFRFGYSKARSINLLPFCFFMAAAAALMALGKAGGFSDGLSEYFSALLNASEIIITLSVLTLILVIFVSYSLSLSFYKKREF